MSKFPPEIYYKVFAYLRSERDAEELFKAVFTNGEDSERNYNKFVKFAESCRWLNGNVAFISSLPYSECYQEEVRRLSIRKYDFSLIDADMLPQEILGMYNQVLSKFHNIKRSMQRLRLFYHGQDSNNSWIWKIESKIRFEKTAQYLSALNNLLELDTPLEYFLEHYENSVTKESYKHYKHIFTGDKDNNPWWMLDTDEEFCSDSEMSE
jgi:transcriptional regulator with XRE-family HTH domain